MRMHWSPKSPYVRKVMVCAHELGLAGRIECVRTAAAMLRPNETLMLDNPLSKIPTLMLDDGTALFDSAVICEYLDALAEGVLFPRQGPLRWQALRWQALGDGLLDLLILWRNERERVEPLGPLMNAFELKARRVLDRLSIETAALDATSFGIGHIGIGCALGYMDFRFSNLNWREQAPRVARWHAQLAERPSFRSTEPAPG